MDKVTNTCYALKNQPNMSASPSSSDKDSVLLSGVAGGGRRELVGSGNG